MSDKKFVWDESVLIPEQVTIPFPVEIVDGVVTKKEEVIHYELPRTELVAFIAEGIDQNFIETTDVDGEKVEKRKPFGTIEAQQRAVIFKYLAKSTRGVKDAKFYEKLEIGVRGMDALVEMLYSLNHIEEVIGTGGNWLMLPTVREMITSEAKAASESPTQTLQA